MSFSLSLFHVVFQRLHDRNVTNRPLCQSSLDLWKLELINGVRVYQATSIETSPGRSSTREPLPPQLPAPFPPTCYTPVSIPASVCSPAGGCWDFHGLLQDPMMLSPGPALQHLAAQYVVANLTSALLTKSPLDPSPSPFTSTCPLSTCGAGSQCGDTPHFPTEV